MTGPSLKLTDGLTMRLCPECKGQGHVPCPKTYGVRNSGYGNRQPSTGHPIPCPLCEGRKAVLT